MIEIKIDENANDQRADRYIHKHFDVPKLLVQKWFRKKKIKRDKKPLKADDRLYTGDVLQCFVHGEERTRTIPSGVKARAERLQVVYEDDNVLVMYKPPGLLSHAAEGKEYGKNIVDYMLAYLIEQGAYHPSQSNTFIPSIVNRLDRNTGGLILGAKNYETLKQLNTWMRDGKIHKYYTAVTTGKKPKTGIYEGTWTKHKNKFQLDLSQQSVGALTKTEIIDVQSIGDYSLCRIRLYTGKTHQIRALFEALGSPILGDPKYENRKENQKLKHSGLQHQFLFATELYVEEYKASNGQPLHVKIDLPDKYNRLLNTIRSTSHD